QPASPPPITWTSGRTLFRRHVALGLQVAAARRQAADRGAPAQDALHQEGGVAVRAGLGDRSIPDHEVAALLGVVGAAVEGAALPRPLLGQVTTAVRPGTVDADRDRHRGLALRVARAGE